MSANNRSHKRQPVSTDAMIYDSKGNPLVSCTLRNVSVGGAQLELAKEIEIPQAFVLSLSRTGDVRRSCRKVWQFSTVAGVKFDKSDT